MIGTLRYLRTCLQTRAAELYRLVFPKPAFRPIEHREAMPHAHPMPKPTPHSALPTPHSNPTPHLRPAPLFQPFLSTKTSPKFRRVSDLFLLPVLCLSALASAAALASEQVQTTAPMA